MSKSKGNVMDPLELVDDYGADALRFTLTAMTSGGRERHYCPRCSPDQVRARIAGITGIEAYEIGGGESGYVAIRPDEPAGERATRPAISRSMKAIKELKSKDYDRDLFLSKAEHLLDKSMLADCYYYAGRIAAKNLVGRKDLFYDRYAKLVQLALDLSSDVQHLEKLQRRLFRAANGGLKG